MNNRVVNVDKKSFSEFLEFLWNVEDKVMPKESKIKWLIVVGMLFLLSYMSYLGNLKQQSNVEPPNPVTTPGEIVATFDNGDGTENYIRKNEKVMQLEVNYPKNIKNNHFLFGMKNHFDYGSTRWLDLNVFNDLFKADMDAYLGLWYGLQQQLKSGDSKVNTPLAGTATNEIFKQLKINGQAVDEVREYKDTDGNTWYLWYYKHIELKSSGNSVTFE